MTNPGSTSTTSPVGGMGGAGIEVLSPLDVPEPGGAQKAIVGRSPGQLAWMRLRRDRSAVVSGGTLLVLMVVGLGAPLVGLIYGQNATDTHPELLDEFGFPLGVNGGMSSDHWLGLEPGLGRDLFMQLVFGMRTSFFVAFGAASLTVAIGVLVGIVAGFFGGIVDSVLNWITDIVLALPFIIFSLAAIPIITNRVYGDDPHISPAFRIWLVILVLVFFGWPYTARLVRGQVLSLREREFVEAARAAGAPATHLLFRQVLPNIWAPILVVFSLAVPGYITAEAALSFLNIGVIEPTPDLGRMIFRSINYLQTDPAFTLLPGVTIFLLVLTFNLFGDSVRDALDPKSSR
jgi:peptide/nickel transport system permease protein